MHAPRFEKRHPARVRVVERVGRGDAADGFLDRGDSLRVLRNRRQGLLMVSQLGRIEREKSCEVRSVPSQVGGVHGAIIGWSDLRKQIRRLSFGKTPQAPGRLSSARESPLIASQVLTRCASHTRHHRLERPIHSNACIPAGASWLWPRPPAFQPKPE